MGRAAIVLLTWHRTGNSAIVDWLLDSNKTATNNEHHVIWIDVLVTVTQAEKLFDTRLSYLVHNDDDSHRVRTLHFSLPSHLHAYISTVQPTILFGQPKVRTTTSPHKRNIDDVDSAAESTAVDTNFDITSCDDLVTTY